MPFIFFGEKNWRSYTVDMCERALGLWLGVVLLGAAVAAACGSSDSQRVDRDGEGSEGGATPGGAAGEPSSFGGSNSGANGGGSENAGGHDSTAGQGGAAASDGGGGGEVVGGAAGAGGTAGTGGQGGAVPVEVVQLGTIATGESLCGVGFDHVAELVWVMPCFGSSLLSYSRAGTPGPTVAVGGEAPNDGDVDVAPVGFTLGQTAMTAGTLLHVNGETGVAEIYALDGSGQAQAPLASLVTAFGNSHVVGGAYHAARGTFFLVQDRVPSAPDANVIAEIDAQTGATLNSFSTLPSLDVNYGDLDVCQSSGNLFVISSEENAIAELNPEGALLAKYPAPFASVSGIAFDDATGEAWASGTNGTLSRLGGMPCAPYGS